MSYYTQMFQALPDMYEDACGGGDDDDSVLWFCIMIVSSNSGVSGCVLW